MRKLLPLSLILLLAIVPFAAVNAAPSDQFAGCADEQGMEFGARFTARRLNGLTMEVTVIGIEDFDPEVTILDAEGNIVTCNDNAGDVAEMAVELPTAAAGPSENSANAQARVPGDEGRLDYQIIVSSADGTSCEFVLLYSGAEIFGADNIDEMTVHSNQGQVDAEVPLVVYVTNLSGGASQYDPALTFSFGEDFKASCYKSSADSLCDGDHEDLTGSTVTLSAEEFIELNGNDVMLAFAMGGDVADFTLEIGSYNAATFGPYTLIVHSGVGYPAP